MDINDLKNLLKQGQFRNPTKGIMTLREVIEELLSYRNENLEDKYQIVIGTDSKELENGVDFVSVIAIHRIGKGGRYFWLRSCHDKIAELRDRIYKEAVMSLAMALAVLEQELENSHIRVAAGKSIMEAIKELKEDGTNNFNRSLIFSNELEIHVDIGYHGPTKAMIKEIVGMIRGSGFYVKIKPEAFGAKVADKQF